MFVNEFSKDPINFFQIFVISKYMKGCISLTFQKSSEVKSESPNPTHQSKLMFIIFLFSLYLKAGIIPQILS